jgi:putative membrane protein
MVNLRGLGTLSLAFVLGATSFVACSDDDDDDSGNVAGRAGASHAGSFNGGAASGEGGDLGNPSRGGASSRGGTSPRGGTASDGGTAASGGTFGMAGEAGAEQGGVGGESGSISGDLGGAGAGGSAAYALSDAQILLVLDTLNQGEVEEAYAALPRLTATDVRAFAQRMVNDHGDARQAVLATASALNLAPLPSDAQAELQSEGEAHVDMLRATPAAALDATYVNLEVAGHAEALNLLDDLASAADAPQLETLITTLRGTVQEHYQSAQELQAEL